MEEWLAYLLTEAPDGPVAMVAHSIHAVLPDIVWPLQDLLGDACRFDRRTLTGTVGPRRVFILLASDPRRDERMRGRQFAGIWNWWLLGRVAGLADRHLLPGARLF